ncbi:MAG: cobalamin biosynthesis protein [Sulfolobales archaeon]|nr:cobalamin biosynthesis protein [Sulfolobales archaeon]MDW8082220.1 cobalamin biosynthesis protein [Sulfolobales archaeon]
MFFWLSFLDLGEAVAILLLAHLMDSLYPYHSGVLLLTHPVHTSYTAAVKLGKPYSSRARGVVTWFIVVISHLVIYWLLLRVALAVSRVFYILLSAYVLKTSFSIRLLLDIVRSSCKSLESGDLDSARYWTKQIVRRDLDSLGESHIASASIESLAESLVDGYISPLFYYAFFGPLGALFQRLVNTLDSALGYKESGFKDVGWFSARLDTVVNFIPARVTALIIVLTSTFLGRDPARALAILARDRRRTESVNAGYPLSAIAGVLGVWLEKVGHYTINSEGRAPGWRDIEASLKVAKLSVVTWLAILITLLAISSFSAVNSKALCELTSLC